jgi:hypothetical protein
MALAANERSSIGFGQHSTALFSITPFSLLKHPRNKAGIESVIALAIKENP